MTLIERVYEGETEESKRIWELPPFAFFSPDLNYLGYKVVRKALSENTSEFFINQIRNNFLPEKGNREVQESYREAMNRGIHSVNKLCIEHLQEDAEPVLIDEVPSPLDLFSFLKQARIDWINAKTRDGRHNDKIDKNLLSQAYDKVRACGLGYIVCLIDSSPEVLNSLRHTIILRDEITKRFRPRKKTETKREGLPYSWRTDAGVDFFGDDEAAFGMRVKILDNEDKPKYGSILMKMFTNPKYLYPEFIKDYVGVEFIVGDNEARGKLIEYIRSNFSGTASRLEAFKSAGEKGAGKRNEHSSTSFDCTKFVLRIPIPVSPIPPYREEEVYERIPVEVQILTLAGHGERMRNSDLTHQAYKKRQFTKAFPLLFPRKIYEHLLEGRE
jgi:hypothetical protein